MRNHLASTRERRGVAECVQHPGWVLLKKCRKPGTVPCFRASLLQNRGLSPVFLMTVLGFVFVRFGLGLVDDAVRVFRRRVQRVQVQ